MVTLSGAAEIVMLSALVTDCAVGVSESVTFTVKLIAPVVVPVGVPVMAPVAAFSVSPAGRLPELILHVSAPAPPVATSVWLYSVPRVPPGSELVLIESVGALTEMLKFAVFVA